MAEIRIELDPNEIVQDSKILSMKNKIMEGGKWSSLLYNISEVCKFVAGPLLFMGAGGLAGTEGALAAVAPFLLGASAVLIVTAVGTSYIASRIGQSSSFDNLEINAQSTARHLVQELKANSMCLVEEHEQNCRADGKKWSETVRPGSQPAVQLS